MDGLIKIITNGKGQAYLVNYEYSDVYMDILENLGIDVNGWDDYAFIEGLTNGGEKGAGLRVLHDTIKTGKELGYRILIFVLSDTNQDKLREWYLSTKLVKQTRLENVLKVI